MTAYEILQMVFNYAGVVPKMISFTQLGYVSVLDEEETKDLEVYSQRTTAYDPSSYRSRIVSNVKNFIAGEDGGILVEPNLTVRSEDSGAITNDDAMITTSRPIYKVEDFHINTYLYARGQDGSIKSNWFLIPYSVIPYS